MSNIDNKKYLDMVKSADADLKRSYPLMSPEIQSNTRQAVMYLNSHINYIKHRYKDKTHIELFEYVVNHINNGFDKVDTKTINKILIKNFIFPNYINTIIAIIIGMIPSFFISSMIFNPSKATPELYGICIMFMVLVGVLISCCAAPLMYHLICNSKFRWYILRDVKIKQIKDIN